MPDKIATFLSFLPEWIQPFVLAFIAISLGYTLAKLAAVMIIGTGKRILPEGAEPSTKGVGKAVFWILFLASTFLGLSYIPEYGDNFAFIRNPQMPSFGFLLKPSFWGLLGGALVMDYLEPKILAYFQPLLSRVSKIPGRAVLFFYILCAACAVYAPIPFVRDAAASIWILTIGFILAAVVKQALRVNIPFEKLSKIAFYFIFFLTIHAAFMVPG